ncbi:hypothetical protein M413DRAFT_28392 [Hebeloma cylindrosporum]|uniref:Uncharacterized protein n=1 Tax=Hebeloma cylindrosporum TaxID=76867 RepID=A0A0C2YHP6_HEBCY|nr:hypothetical protein M413DRAFT_28392 [Hebeloma cylindrosporum h7]
MDLQDLFNSRDIEGNESDPPYVNSETEIETNSDIEINNSPDSDGDEGFASDEQMDDEEISDLEDCDTDQAQKVRMDEKPTVNLRLPYVRGSERLYNSWTLYPSDSMNFLMRSDESILST